MAAVWNGLRRQQRYPDDDSWHPAEHWRHGIAANRQHANRHFVRVLGNGPQPHALGSLPALLDGVGMPGCRTYTSADLLVTLPASNGIATWTWNVPMQSILLGEALFMQGVTFDPGINALGLAVSPAATMVIGN